MARSTVRSRHRNRTASGRFGEHPVVIRAVWVIEVDDTLAIAEQTDI